MELTRRRTLIGGSLLGSSLLAGCLDDGPAPDGDGSNGDEDGTDGDGSDDEDGTDGEDDTGGDDQADGYELVEYDAIFYSDPDAETDVDPLYDADDVDRVVDRPSDDLEAFLDETDFDRAKLLSIRVQAPNLCYGLELEDVDADEDGVTVTARAVDESGPDEACAQQVHAASALVRLVFAEEVPTSGTVTVVDGHGSQHGFGYDAAHEGDAVDGGGERDRDG